MVCGYALRNFTDLAASLAEAARVLRPGGRLAVLEVADRPSAGLMRRGFELWFGRCVPAIGGAALGRRRLPLPPPIDRLPAR